MVIIGGGDGTLNAAAAGLAELKLPLGILPLGTANDLARTLKIPPDLKSALEIIGGGRIRSIDVGIVNDVMFFNVASIGLSAELAEKLTAETKRRFGKFGYALTTLRVLAGARPFRCGHFQRRQALALPDPADRRRQWPLLWRRKCRGKGAEIDDEILRLYSLEFVKAWRMLLLLHTFRSGEHGAWMRSVRSAAREIRDSDRGVYDPVNADGEIVDTHARGVPGDGAKAPSKLSYDARGSPPSNGRGAGHAFPGRGALSGTRRRLTPPSARVRPRTPPSAPSCRPCRRRSSAARRRT